MICRRTQSNDILLELVAKTLAVGAYEMQVEYEDARSMSWRFKKRLASGYLHPVCFFTSSRDSSLHALLNPQNLDLSSLVKSPSHAGPLIVSDITNPFFAEIIPAIEERLGRSHLYSGKIASALSSGI